jgi:EmrB/QacA subfamily drug resistance transporter
MTEQREHSTNPWVVLVLICMAQFMVVLDATVTNVALPSIQKDLGLSEANLQWIINAYTLVFGGFLLLGGRLGDLLGRKRLFMIGLVIFTFASLMNGLANSEGMLIGFRALQGLGAALISPAALSIISTTFEEGAERAKALAVWAAIAIGGAAFGLILGGALTEWLSWPWIFFVNVPVGIVVFLLSLRLVPESRDENAAGSYDIAGAVTVTGGLMALVYAIVHAESAGWTATTTIGFFVLSAVLLVSFVLIEMRTKAPLVRLSIFRIRSLTTANITMFLAMSAMFAMFFFNTLYIQKVLGYAPLKAGFAFLPFTAGIMVSAGLASALAPRIGVRPVAAVGMLLSAAGLLLLTQIPVNGSYVADVLPAMILTSLGMGAVFMPLTLVATTGLDNEDQGLASGLFNTSQQIGGALGLAVLSTIAAGRTKAAASSGASQAEALVHGFHWAYAGAAVIVLGALVVMLAMLRAKDVARIEAEARAGSTEPVFAEAA